MLKFSRILNGSPVRAPIPLSVRYDSLLVQCCIAAVVYFGPQDAAIAGLAFLNGRAHSNTVNKPVSLENPNAALEKFYEQKGLDKEKLRVLGQSGNKWELRFTNVYN